MVHEMVIDSIKWLGLASLSVPIAALVSNIVHALQASVSSRDPHEIHYRSQAELRIDRVLDKLAEGIILT